MWSVPFNFNLRDSYYAVGMVYQKVIAISFPFKIFFIDTYINCKDNMWQFFVLLF
jgi:hypothetical protein